jgi:hypothetical protein
VDVRAGHAVDALYAFLAERFGDGLAGVHCRPLGVHLDGIVMK